MTDVQLFKMKLLLTHSEPPDNWQEILVELVNAADTWRYESNNDHKRAEDLEHEVSSLEDDLARKEREIEHLERKVKQLEQKAGVR